MTVKLIASEIANKFFFLSNLSNWHFSCTPYFNEDWLSQTGPLTPKEQAVLNDFAKVLKKHGFEDYIGKYFFSDDSSNIWETLKKNVAASDFNIIESCFTVFEPRFQRIWVSDKPNLLKWQQKLDEILKSDVFKEPIKELTVFFGHAPQVEGTRLILLLSTLNGGCGGSAMQELGCVMLECSALPLNETNRLLRITLHELVHLVFSYGEYNELLLQQGKTTEFKSVETRFNRPIQSILNEAVHASVVNAYLGDKYFQGDVKTKARILFNSASPASQFENYWHWEVFISAEMMNTVASYIKGGKSVDENFIFEIKEKLKRFQN
ncbi:MAG: hypothetical protein NT141_00070 [candidate division WWE3 bacterium]|nr:hypothetical protein [candidate division WWE3 bacterium]